MPHVVYPSSRVEAERTIAIARIVLAATALLALWLDPIEPPVYADLTYRLQSVYLLYSVAVLAWTFGDVGEWQPLGTHAVDVLAHRDHRSLGVGERGAGERAREIGRAHV